MSDYLIIIQDKDKRRRGSIGVFRCETEEDAIGAAQEQYPQLFDFIRAHDWVPRAEEAYQQ